MGLDQKEPLGRWRGAKEWGGGGERRAGAGLPGIP